MKRYYIGVDGGGTKTEFLLTDEKENIIKRVIKGGSNPNDIGLSNSYTLLLNGIKELLSEKEIDIRKVSIFAGISGAGVGNNANWLQQNLAKDYPCVEVGNDLVTALEVCLGREDGIAVICGTGISCSILIKGKRKTLGGYGYLFEDGGSGYAYGRDAIKAALAYEDGFGKETVLTKYLYEELGVNVRAALFELLQGGKSKIASYCPLVFKGYTENDDVCKQIVKDNLDCVVKLVKNALYLSGFKKTKLAFMGGVSKEKCFQARMKNEFEHIHNLYFCAEKPVLGAVRCAMKKTKS